MMRSRMLLFVLVLCSTLAAPVCFAIDPTELQDPALQARYYGLTHELRCMQCQDQTLADSPVGLASDLRRQVRELLLAGKTDDEIKNYMSERYTDFILFKPRYSGRSAWLWLTPGVFLLIGAAVAVRIVRQRGRLLENDHEPVEEDARVS